MSGNSGRPSIGLGIGFSNAIIFSSGGTGSGFSNSGAYSNMSGQPRSTYPEPRRYHTLGGLTGNSSNNQPSASSSRSRQQQPLAQTSSSRDAVAEMHARAARLTPSVSKKDIQTSNSRPAVANTNQASPPTFGSSLSMRQNPVSPIPSSIAAQATNRGPSTHTAGHESTQSQRYQQPAHNTSAVPSSKTQTPPPRLVLSAPAHILSELRRTVEAKRLVLADLRRELAEQEGAVEEEKRIFEKKYEDVEAYLKGLQEAEQQEIADLQMRLELQRKLWTDKINALRAGQTDAHELPEVKVPHHRRIQDELETKNLEVRDLIDDSEELHAGKHNTELHEVITNTEQN